MGTDRFFPEIQLTHSELRHITNVAKFFPEIDPDGPDPLDQIADSVAERAKTTKAAAYESVQLAYMRIQEESRDRLHPR